MSKPGFLVVLSGPSGGGKGTVVRRVREMMPEIALSVSATTRPPRAGEVDGKDYYFMDRDTFEEMVAREEMLEYTCYCGNYYGTPKKEAQRILLSGKNLILEIEVEGNGQVKRLYPDAVSIMLIPPTIEEMRRRLLERGTEPLATVEKRLARAAEEIQFASNYDYIVINHRDGIETCARQICEIVRSESARASRMTEEIEAFLI